MKEFICGRFPIRFLITVHFILRSTSCRLNRSSGSGCRNFDRSLTKESASHMKQWHGADWSGGKVDPSGPGGAPSLTQSLERCQRVLATRSVRRAVCTL